MGYSTKAEVVQALANALSRGNPSAGGGRVDIISIGNTLSDTVTEAALYQYIRWADENIDAELSSVYLTPFKRVNRGSYALVADALVGSLYVLVADSTRFNPDDVVLIRDDVHSQELTISAVPTATRLNFTAPLTNSYLANTTNIERIKYPDPIPKISAKLAAAHLYDKYFAAQVEGNQTEVSKVLRSAAYDDINAILSGAIRLTITDANKLIGARFYNPALDNVWATKSEPKQWFKGGM